MTTNTPDLDGAGRQQQGGGVVYRTVEDVLAAAEGLSREQADALADHLVGGRSASQWRPASAWCRQEVEAADAALKRAGRWQEVFFDLMHQARHRTTEHGRYGAILAVQRTVTALAAVELVDTTADARGWSPDAYARLTSAWTTVMGQVRPAPAPEQQMLDLTDWNPLARTPVGETGTLWEDQT